MVETKPLSEALRSEILKLVTDGDKKSDGALTAQVLLRVMRVAKTGRALIMSLEASPKNLADMVRRPKPGLGTIYSPYVGGDGDDFEEEGTNGPIPFATSTPNENFGMTAIREIVAAAKNLNGGTSPSKLVEALAIAREKGLDDIAVDLERQLGVKKEKPALEVANLVRTEETK